MFVWLLISPIYLGDNVWRPECDPEFSKASIIVSQRLQPVYENIAKKWNVGFLRAADYAVCSAKDQEHMNAAGHAAFAEAVSREVRQLFAGRQAVGAA